MTISEIKNIVRKDVPIYYRRVYAGCAILDFAGKKHQVNLDWTIETSPFGTKETTVTVSDKVDYPLIPLIKGLKVFIEKLDNDGKLPPL
ncbi:MAG: hypothetical protein Ta2B_18960 [Termitinemataceae bacterium]|nr:MAG: hypothetical protein Ta2B_18960 [Termitinemataceae bacterium]